MTIGRQCWLAGAQRQHLVGVEWRVHIGLDGQPNSLPGGFAEVELEGHEKVAGMGSTPVGLAVSII
jgi:hypothetical protein